MQSGLPADAASLRETGSVDRYTPRGPVSVPSAVQCLVSLILSLMAPRVCTLVLSSFPRDWLNQTRIRQVQLLEETHVVLYAR